MNNYLFKYDYAELRIRCRAYSETDEGECNTLRILENADNPKYQKVKQMR